MGQIRSLLGITSNLSVLSTTYKYILFYACPSVFTVTVFKPGQLCIRSRGFSLAEEKKFNFVVEGP